jgi:hypothetical protein
MAFVLSSLAVYAASPAAAASAGAKADSKWVGSYESDPPKPGTTGASMSLSLGDDGTATVTQDPGNGEITTFGHWSDTGGGITVTFDPVAGTPTPAPMNFSSSHDGLQAATWDHTVWGKLTPPPMKKSADWHKGRHPFGA